jgi:hypothetical protein
MRAAAASALPRPRQASTLKCATTWSYIRAGDDGYLKPDANGTIYANGNRNSDYWNQQFLQCHFISSNQWPPEDYAFLSNRTGHWLQADRVTGQLNANGTLNSTDDHLPAFRVIRYDSNFWYFVAGGLCQWPDGDCPYVQVKKNVTPGPPVYADQWGPLNGWNLLRIQTRRLPVVRPSGTGCGRDVLGSPGWITP